MAVQEHGAEDTRCIAVMSQGWWMAGALMISFILLFRFRSTFGYVLGGLATKPSKGIVETTTLPSVFIFRMHESRLYTFR